ncbi:MAG: hypothetical protein IT324_24585 [Anaerolineae bacterium]|nr:hypothetical protein [Anaerolineae bacterium]
MTTITHANPSLELDIEKFPLILFAPRLRNSNAQLSHFLRNSTHVFFYALTPSDADLLTFLSHVVEGVQDYSPGFGKQTQQALAQPKVTPAELVDAFIADLNKAKPKPTYIILDEFDYLTDSVEVRSFFNCLISKLPGNMRLVINSRQLPYDPWYTYVQAGTAAVLGTANVLDGSILNPESPASPHLEVYGFGSGRVFVNGLPIDTWDGPLPRNLFYYFADHPMVTRDEIFETFWPELPTKEATNVFHVTKRKISERLGYELTAYSGGFYRPSEQMILHYDVARFEDAVKIGRDLPPAESLDAWHAAIHLYRSQFLHKVEMPWIARRREELRLTYAEALISVGRVYKGQGDTELAIAYYLRALREVPQREDIHRDVMSLYEKRGERDKAVAQYKLLSNTLKRTLNITPSKATRTLYQSLIGETNG